MLNKRKTIIWLAVAVLVGVALCFLFSNYDLKEKRKGLSYYRNPQNQLSLENLLEILKKQELVDVSIYYIPFGVVCEGPLGEDHVLQMSGLRVTIDNIAPFHHPYLQSILDNISTSTVKQNLPPYNDFRYLCLIKSESDKYIRFLISKKSQDAIFINGQAYEVPFKVIDGFLKLLPAREYELAIKEYGADKN